VEFKIFFFFNSSKYLKFWFIAKPQCFEIEKSRDRGGEKIVEALQF